MTRQRLNIPSYIPPTYEQHLVSFERGLSRLVCEVRAMNAEEELTQAHRTEFGYLFNTALAHLFWSKERIADAFSPLNTDQIICVDSFPGPYRREGVWAERFGAEEIVVHFDLMTRSAAAKWIVDYGHKVGYTSGQIEKARLESKALRRRAA